MKNNSLTLWRIIRTGAINFSRNLSLVAAAMAVMVVTLTIILFSVIASVTFDNTIRQISNKIDISVYLGDSVTTQQVNGLVGRLRLLPNVKSVSYISQDQALAEYKAENASNKTLLTAISETNNPLPASIQIQPIDINKIQGIKNFLDKPQYLALQDPQAGTSYSGDRKAAIDQIAHATNIIREAGIIAVVVFAMISVLIIFNTIRMAIFNRRDEIGIMSLLGASPAYIRGPFVVESMIYGIISALVSVLIIDVLFAGSASALKASSLGLLDIGYADSFFKSHFWLLLVLELMVGILIGTASSVIATKRYLKIKPTK
ncbi:MAG TPA: permease-like cell division protein FtsX [Patescibacteria group bacterium]|jgi:cell division transport system permease protein|nr:permease-like cell division protein FtsX [Patescibacteria group bacterium]